jgi:hypothetical protein
VQDGVDCALLEPSSGLGRRRSHVVKEHERDVRTDHPLPGPPAREGPRWGPTQRRRMLAADRSSPTVPRGHLFRRRTTRSRCFNRHRKSPPDLQECRRCDWRRSSSG